VWKFFSSIVRNISYLKMAIMKHPEKYILILLLLIVQALCAQDRRSERIDSLVSVLAANKLFNGSILVAEHGRVIYRRSVGDIDFEHHIPNSDTTIFNLASLSKPLTAVAVLQLVQKGKVKLDDPLSKYFKDFPYPEIQIRYLLSQSSGLPVQEKAEAPYIAAHPDEILNNQEVYAHLVAAKTPLLFPPGSNWGYNNTNYVLLALLVEKIGGRTFNAYMKAKVFRPAGMSKSYIRLAGMPNTPRYIIPNYYTSAYQNVDSLDHVQNYTFYNLGSLYGPANVMSTLQDLLKFDQALMAGKLINKNLLKLAFSPLILNNGKVFHMGASTRSYGLGWNVYTSKTAHPDTMIFHDGHVVGITTVSHHNLSKDQTIIFYDNTNHAPLQLMVGISNILNGISPGNFRVTQSLASVYGETLVSNGINAAISKLLSLKSDTAHYYIDESEMNTLGFDLLKAPMPDHFALSLEAFKINILLFPKSGNAYDSYAQALEKAGDNNDALLMYQKSLTLWPDNEEGKKAVKRLSGR